jgi:hypothetical protein
MKNRFLFLLSILLMFSCKHEMIKEKFFKTGELESKCIYPDKRDTMNFQQLDYYPTGEILRKTSIKNGQSEGEYIMYLRSGDIAERGRLLQGKIDGIFQKYDSIGRLAQESYFINGTRILYSEFFESKDKELMKQLFNVVINDSTYPIGALVKKGDTIQENISQYAIITGEDSIHTLNYCFKLRILNDQKPDTKYQITIGTPNNKLEFDKVDTSFISSNNEILICNLRLVPGLNHLFSRIYVYDDDTASFYAYKDIFITGQNKK